MNAFTVNKFFHTKWRYIVKNCRQIIIRNLTSSKKCFYR
jgi:hypothetical protein